MELNLWSELNKMLWLSEFCELAVNKYIAEQGKDQIFKVVSLHILKQTGTSCTDAGILF
jgi:hypothetical protein